MCRVPVIFLPSIWQTEVNRFSLIILTTRFAFKKTRQDHGFDRVAMVVLPDHLHTLWQVTEDDANYAMRWNLIKRRFSRILPKNERISTSRQKKGERGVWQRRYWEHLIKNDDDFERHVNYNHYNPVKHGYVCSSVGLPKEHEGLIPAFIGMFKKESFLIIGHVIK